MVRTEVMPNMAMSPYAKELGIVDPEEQENVPSKTPHHKVNLERLEALPKAVRYDITYHPSTSAVAVATRDNRSLLGPSAMSQALVEEKRSQGHQNDKSQIQERNDQQRHQRYNKAMERLAMEKTRQKMLQELDILAQTDKAARKDTAVSATWMDEAKTRQKRFHQYQGKLEREFERRFVDQAVAKDEIIRRKKSEMASVNSNQNHGNVEADIIQYEIGHESSTSSSSSSTGRSNISQEVAAKKPDVPRSIHIHVNTPEPGRKMIVPREPVNQQSPPIDEKSPFKRTFRPIVNSTSELALPDELQEPKAPSPFIITGGEEMFSYQKEELKEVSKEEKPSTIINNNNNHLQASLGASSGMAAAGGGTSSTSSFAESTPSSLAFLLESSNNADDSTASKKGKAPMTAAMLDSSMGSTPFPIYKRTSLVKSLLSEKQRSVPPGSSSSSSSSFVIPSEMLDSDFSLPTTFSSPISSEVSMRSLKSLFSEMDLDVVSEIVPNATDNTSDSASELLESLMKNFPDLKQ